MFERYKLVVRNNDGKVQQIHEVYRNDIPRYLMAELDKGFRVTVTELKKES